MARDHALIFVSIWEDPDFVALKSGEQSAYFKLISSRDISYCGVLPYLPKRIARLAADTTERQIVQAMARLADARFVVIDHDTDELLVRSYVRHDGILKMPNVVRAMNKAWERVHSEHLRQVIYEETVRAIDEQFPTELPKGLRDALAEGFAEPFLEGIG